MQYRGKLTTTDCTVISWLCFGGTSTTLETTQMLA